jgi:hypothetical protein
MCGGTIYRYHVTGSRTGCVETFCYTCHATGVFYLDASPQDVQDVSCAHRAA